MKQLFLFFIMYLYATTYLVSQDVIFLKNGDEISAKIEKVGSKEIEYKKWKNLNGPLYSISKDDVFLIKYSNGEKDVFANDLQKRSINDSNNASNPKYVKKNPTPTNKALIDRYNVPIQFAKKPKNRKTTWGFRIMAISDSSILSTSEIELNLKLRGSLESMGYSEYTHVMEITNKTNKILYIDLGNSFKVFKDGTAVSCYDNSEITHTSGGASGTAFNAGGVTNALGIGGIIGAIANATTIGESSQESVSVKKKQERFISIPPQTKRIIPDILKRECDANFHKQIRKVLKKDGYISYSEEDTPFSTNYLITYSTNPNFSEYSMLKLKIYMRYFYGNNYYDFQGYDGIKKYITNFGNDTGIIVGSTEYLK